MALNPMGQLENCTAVAEQPDDARYEQKTNGECWMINRQEGMLLQIKPDKPTQHAQFVLVSTYRLSARLVNPSGRSGCSDI